MTGNPVVSIMPRSRRTWHRAFQDGLVSGTVASVVSTVSLAILGKAELNKAAAPINGPSQWVWGKHAPYENRFSLRYTVTGYAIHHAASVFWASLYEKLRQRLGSPPDRTAPVASAIVITTTAYAVDFHVIPKRLTPGFEHRLSKRSLLMVYGAFAIGLAAVALMDRHGKAPHAKASRPIKRTSA
ncbi:MAG: hypothetical protein ABI167_08990 [Nitrosospira sp.]